MYLSFFRFLYENDDMLLFDFALSFNVVSIDMNFVGLDILWFCFDDIGCEL
jgi:hypothetical protein